MQTFQVLGPSVFKTRWIFWSCIQSCIQYASCNTASFQRCRAPPTSVQIAEDSKHLPPLKYGWFKHLIKDISFLKWMLWTWRCVLLCVASPKQDTTSFYCLWHFRKYYPCCVCNTLCPFLHTSEALEQICILRRILIEVFLPISDLLKKHCITKLTHFWKVQA